MKTKILTIIAFAAMLSVLPVNAQDIFPLSGAKWTEVIEYDYNYPIIEYQYFSYVLQGDTVIDDILRSKLHLIPRTSTDTDIVGFIHIQDSTVFYRGVTRNAYYPLCDVYHQQDYPLYDFSLSIGDSFFDCSASMHYVDWDYYSVLDVDAVNLGGIGRKRITLAWTWEEQQYIRDQWIEGMGSVNGLFYGKEAIRRSDGSNKYFVCFTQNDELIYLNPRYSDCQGLSFKAIPEVKTNPLRIFPNPMKSTATVQSDYPLQSVQIYDISGVLLYKQTCKGELQTTINKQSLLQGSYFIKVILQTGETQIEKLIVQ